MNSEQHWIERAEAALAGGGDDGTDVIGTRKPPVLDAEGIKAVMAPFFAALFYLAGYFMEQELGYSPMYPGVLLVWLIALGFTARTAILGATLLVRFGVYRNAARYGLALTDDGLLYRSPAGDVAVPRAAILEIRERGEWRKRTAARRYAPVYVVTQPQSGRTHVELPPLFDESPTRLAERLQRWQGELDTQADYEPPGASELPSKLFDAAATGELATGVTAIKHGNGWLRRGPYATVLMGTALANGFFRLPQQTQETVGLIAPGIILFALLGVPILWFIATSFDIAPRKGLSVVLTPAELIMRTRTGVHVVKWRELRHVEIKAGSGWSILQGQHESRALVFHRKCGDCKGTGLRSEVQCKRCDGSGRDMDYISYVEVFLGAPAEVVYALVAAYRTGRIRADAIET